MKNYKIYVIAVLVISIGILILFDRTNNEDKNSELKSLLTAKVTEHFQNIYNKAIDNGKLFKNNPNKGDAKFRASYIAKLQAKCFVDAVNEWQEIYRQYLFHQVAEGKSIPEAQAALSTKIAEDIKSGKQLALNVRNMESNFKSKLNMCSDEIEKKMGTF